MAKRVLVLPENTKGRDFVVGDIHGIFDVLDDALKAVNFDPAVDRLISVGDLIDRGPQSPKCVEYLRQPWFFATLGNHEAMFLHFYKDGSIEPFRDIVSMRNGMAWILNEKKEVLDQVKEALQKLPIAIEIQTQDEPYGFVHADIPHGMSWQTFTRNLEDEEKRTTKAALWGRTRIDSEDDSGVKGAKRVFLGHTPVAGGAKKLGNCYYMDTGGVFRVLYGGIAAKFHLTVADIRARSNDIAGLPDDNKTFKVALRKPKPPSP